MATKIVLMEVEVPNSQHCFGPKKGFTFHCDHNNLFEGGSYHCNLFNSRLEEDKKNSLPLKCSECLAMKDKE